MTWMMTDDCSLNRDLHACSHTEKLQPAQNAVATKICNQLVIVFLDCTSCTFIPEVELYLSWLVSRSSSVVMK